MNHLLASDTPLNDKSTQADNRHFGHCIRVLVAWWKATHYVQNQDTTDYYARILGQVVGSPKTLHQWPQHVTGICIDARVVSPPKEYPKVSLEYFQRYTAPDDSNKTNKITQIRSFSTGGDPPCLRSKAPKDERRNTGKPRRTARHNK